MEEQFEFLEFHWELGSHCWIIVWLPRNLFRRILIDFMAKPQTVRHFTNIHFTNGKCCSRFPKLNQLVGAGIRAAPTRVIFRRFSYRWVGTSQTSQTGCIWIHRRNVWIRCKCRKGWWDIKGATKNWVTTDFLQFNMANLAGFCESNQSTHAIPAQKLPQIHNSAASDWTWPTYSCRPGQTPRTKRMNFSSMWMYVQIDPSSMPTQQRHQNKWDWYHGK